MNPRVYTVWAPNSRCTVYLVSIHGITGATVARYTESFNGARFIDEFRDKT